MAAVEQAATAPEIILSLSEPGDDNGVPRGVCDSFFSRSKCQALRVGTAGVGAKLKPNMGQASPGLSGGADDVTQAMGISAEGGTFQEVNLPDGHRLPNRYKKVRLNVADWDVAPPSRRVEEVPECHVAPETTDDAAATLRVAHRMKRKMESDFLEVLDSLLNLHLCATRRERLTLSFLYSQTRTYRRDTSPRKGTVGHCQALRQATAAAAGASKALVANPGLLVAIMADTFRRARVCGGVTVARVVSTQAGYSSRLRTQFNLDKNVGG